MRKREYGRVRPGWPEISWGDKSARFAREVPRRKLQTRCARDGRASRGETREAKEKMGLFRD
jgi:hypothetical protein